MGREYPKRNHRGGKITPHGMVKAFGPYFVVAGCPFFPKEHATVAQLFPEILGKKRGTRA